MARMDLDEPSITLDKSKPLRPEKTVSEETAQDPFHLHSIRETEHLNIFIYNNHDKILVPFTFTVDQVRLLTLAQRWGCEVTAAEVLLTLLSSHSLTVEVDTNT